MKTTCLLLVVLAFTVQVSKQDSCHMRELDLCAATALLSLQSNPVPQNEAEIDKQCEYLKESAACAKNYTNKCATPLYKQLISFVTSESEENMNNFCTPGHEIRQTLLKHSKCLAEVWDEQEACTNDAQAAVEKLSSVALKDQINLACCTYRRFRTCGTDLIEKKCGAEARDFVFKFVSFFVSNLPDVACNNFSAEDATCKALLPPVGTPPKGDNNSPLSQVFSIFSRH